MEQKKCSHKRCSAPDLQCEEGYDHYTECPNWKADSDLDTDQGDRIPVQPGMSVAWSGNTLGKDDLAYIAARRRPKVIGIVGPHNAGKTTFLSLVYLLYRKGIPLASCHFAGSYSLGGWEKLGKYMTWNGDAGPTFPPHTAASDGRRPGLLHLAYRNDDGLLRDTLWTDAPGEWFRTWSVNSKDENASGARWVHKHADVFLLFADSDALAGPSRGEACEKLLRLIERLQIDILDRPVGLIWAKSDLEPPVPDPIRAQVSEAIRKSFELHRIFSIRVPQKNPDNKNMDQFVQIINWVITPASIPYVKLALPIIVPDNPFLAFRNGGSNAK